MGTATIDDAIDTVEILAKLVADPKRLWADIKASWVDGRKPPAKRTAATAKFAFAIDELEATGIDPERARRIWVILTNLNSIKEKP